MKKIVLSIFIMLTLIPVSFSKELKRDFSTVIDESGVDKESISVSIKNAETGKVIYALNDKILMHPASVQKVLTTPVIAETLGDDYELKTELYSRGEDSYVIKLGADPYLTSESLAKLIAPVKVDTKKIFIDSSILDSKTWGEGWQWDDDLNVLMPRFSSYNLDKNLIKITIVPDSNSPFATIINPSKYPLVFFNNVTKGDKTKIELQRDNAISANTLMLSGTVSRPTTIYIPNNNLKRYFNLQLSRALENKKIYLKEAYVEDFLRNSDILLNSATHTIDIAIDDILKKSNNMVSETLFKLAGAKHCNFHTGTDSAGIKMFNDYCKKNNLDNSRIRITDASGVSKNNLVSTDFMTEFLKLNTKNSLMNKLPSPGEGTLTHRMLPLKNQLKAKTGTMSDISSIAGYLTSKSGKNLVFCIIINDMQLSSSDKKMLEDFLIREAYLKL